MSHISHVYENGANLYFTFLSPMEKGNEEEDYKQFHKGLVDAIHNNKGSLSHHHGIGRTLADKDFTTNSPELRIEKQVLIDVYRQINKILDKSLKGKEVIRHGKKVDAGFEVFKNNKANTDIDTPDDFSKLSSDPD